MGNKVKSGTEILNEFFTDTINKIENVNVKISEAISTLYQKGKLTDTNIKNELQKLRDKDANKA